MARSQPVITRDQSLRLASQIARNTKTRNRERLEALAFVARLMRYDSPPDDGPPPPTDPIERKRWDIARLDRWIVTAGDTARVGYMKQRAEFETQLAALELERAAAEERARNLSTMSPDEATEALMARLREKPLAVLQVLHCSLRDLLAERGVTQP